MMFEKLLSGLKDGGEGESLSLSFEDKMLRRVNDDFADASDFMDGYHRRCADTYEMYHSWAKYKPLRKSNKFPMSVLQKLTDVLVAVLMDKLFFNNRPCTVVGVEQTDKADAQIKQDLMMWQDYKDKIRTKVKLAIKDAALYQMCVSQVDYSEVTRRQQVPSEVEQPVTDEYGYPVMNDFGVPLKEKVTVYNWEDVPVYMGPTIRRTDPTDVFFGREKESVEDEHPIMIRSNVTKRYLSSKPYFFNLGLLDTPNDGDMPVTPKSDAQQRKDDLIGQGQSSEIKKTGDHSYVEWQGWVNKKDLVEFTGDVEGDVEVDENETTRCICGVVDGKTVVRLEESIFEMDKPNIIIGTICPEESKLIGLGLAQKVEAMQRGSDDLMGMLMENLKQIVNKETIVNVANLVGPAPKVNQPGGIWKTNTDIDKLMKKVDQQMLAPDLWQLLSLMNQWAQDSSGVHDVIQGKGDANAETLGEASQAMAQATLLMNEYLRSFEESYIQPLYEMRNIINMQFLTEDYVYGIVGEGAVEWRQASVGQIRANTDFICESATREATRNVMIQQILESIQLAPLAIQSGQPVRMDKMMGKLWETGFNWKREDIEQFLPLLAWERINNQSVDQLLVEGAVNQYAFMAGMGALPGGTPAGGGVSAQGGQGSPAGTDQSGAIEANQKFSP